MVARSATRLGRRSTSPAASRTRTRTWLEHSQRGGYGRPFAARYCVGDVLSQLAPSGTHPSSAFLWLGWSFLVLFLRHAGQPISGEREGIGNV
jgi:hypothetical protein